MYYRVIFKLARFAEALKKPTVALGDSYASLLLSIPPVFNYISIGGTEN